MDAATSTGLVVGIVLIALVRSNKNSDLVIWAGVMVLAVIPYRDSQDIVQNGVISISDALGVVTNEGVIAIAALFVVAAGVKETGFMNTLLEKTFKNTRIDLKERSKILGTTSLVSAFFNNTPLMAVLVPAIGQSSKQFGHSPSHILMPLSFAAILGGSCTLIGTNTNLMINAWLIDSSSHEGFGIFEITPIMFPGAVLGCAALIYLSPKILPKRIPVLRQLGDLTDYTVEMVVSETSSIVGLTVEDAGLRGLKSLYLVEILRRKQRLAAVSGNIVIEAGDTLCFVGVTASKSGLEEIDGLTRTEERSFDFSETENRKFVEIVVNASSSLIDKNVRESRFRTVYSAAILAVARNGKHVKGKIGDITIQEGDTLLLETRKNFFQEHGEQADFLVVSESKMSANVGNTSSSLALGIVFTMILIVALEVTSLMTAAIVSAVIMILTKCCSLETARKAIDWQIMLTIGGTLALGKAMAASGLASLLGEIIVIVTPAGETFYLIAFLVLSSIASNMISSKAGALFVLPIAASTAQILDVSLIPLVLSIMVGASMAVASPLTYPSNLMVYGPGGYVFTDYIRLGLPITIITGIIGVIMIALLFPF